MQTQCVAYSGGNVTPKYYTFTRCVRCTWHASFLQRSVPCMISPCPLWAYVSDNNRPTTFAAWSIIRLPCARLLFIFIYAYVLPGIILRVFTYCLKYTEHYFFVIFICTAKRIPSPPPQNE